MLLGAFLLAGYHFRGRRRPEIARNPGEDGEAEVAVVLAEPVSEQPSWLRLQPKVQESSEFSRETPERIGSYQILETLGRGGMATVFRARDTRDHRMVALKVVRPEMHQNSDFMRRFEREIELSKDLKHPNLVEVFEAGLMDNQLCMAMEVVEGLTLEEILESGPLPLEDFPLLASQVASGLHFAHRRNLFHRDMKPANIVVARDGTLKILDFGLAIEEGQDRFTVVGFSMGTPTYMAPEAFTAGLSDAQSDQYSLGVVFYHMLTGLVPFRGDKPVDVARGHVQVAPTPPTTLRPEVPGEWEDIVLRMLSKSPQDRFASLQDVRTRLNTALLQS